MVYEGCVDPLHFPATSNLSDQTARLDREALTKSIVTAINNLSVCQKEIFILYHYKGYTIENIARCMKRNEAEVEVTLDLANEEIFNYLRNHRIKSS